MLNTVYQYFYDIKQATHKMHGRCLAIA